MLKKNVIRITKDFIVYVKNCVKKIREWEQFRILYYFVIKNVITKREKTANYVKIIINLV